jgi:hypothetical protein
MFFSFIGRSAGLQVSKKEEIRREKLKIIYNFTIDIDCKHEVNIKRRNEVVSRRYASAPVFSQDVQPDRLP